MILPDPDFLARERGMLGRMEVGLADEGVRVIHAVPLSSDSVEAAGVYSTQLSYQDKGLPLTLGVRAAGVVRAVREALPTDNAEDRLIDAIYVAGERAWPMGFEIGRQVGAAVLLEVWRPGAGCSVASQAVGWTRKLSAKSVLRGLSIRLLAPDNPTAALLRKDVPAALVPLVPWGVHPGEFEQSARTRPGGATTVLLHATGSDPLAVRAAIEGLARVAAQRPDIHVLVDAWATRAMPLWSWASGSSLTSRMSVIPDSEGRRELPLHADMLMVPEATGEHRSIVLDALASRTLVLAARDVMVEWLSDDRTALLVDRAEPEVFAGALLSVLGEGPGGRGAQLREAAFADIRDRRLGSTQVRALLSVCDGLAESAAGQPRYGGTDA